MPRRSFVALAALFGLGLSTYRLQQLDDSKFPLIQIEPPHHSFLFPPLLRRPSISSYSNFDICASLQ